LLHALLHALLAVGLHELRPPGGVGRVIHGWVVLRLHHSESSVGVPNHLILHLRWGYGGGVLLMRLRDLLLRDRVLNWRLGVLRKSRGITELRRSILIELLSLVLETRVRRLILLLSELLNCLHILILLLSELLHRLLHVRSLLIGGVPGVSLSGLLGRD